MPPNVLHVVLHAVRLHNDRCRVFLPGLIHTHGGERQCEAKFVKTTRRRDSNARLFTFQI